MKEVKWEMQEMMGEGLLPQFTMEEAVMELVLEAKSWAEVELECVMRLDDETGRVEDEINKLRELIVEIIQNRDDAESRHRLSREIVRRRQYITQIKESVACNRGRIRDNSHNGTTVAEPPGALSGYGVSGGLLPLVEVLS